MEDQPAEVGAERAPVHDVAGRGHREPCPKRKPVLPRRESATLRYDHVQPEHGMREDLRHTRLSKQLVENARKHNAHLALPGFGE
jgi:hypothetical protein